MKKRSPRKLILIIVIGLSVALLLFLVGTFLFHTIESRRELAALTEQGYYNPVSVGDYSLNVAVFGNRENPKHTIVGIAGLGSGDFSVAMRQMTTPLETDNLVVFPDRAGYGLSDDTENAMTTAYIVEDYRRALQNAGIEGPYILMPHSIGGAYANDWVSRYPDEIEAVILVDGSQLSADAFSDEPVYDVGIGDRLLASLAKLGMSRYVLRHYFYHYPDNYSEEEQYLADALMYRTLDSIATVSESGLLAENAQTAFNGIITNDLPKLYICASWGLTTEEEFLRYLRWMNRQRYINGMDKELRPDTYDKEQAQALLEEMAQLRRDVIEPYAEKMGNCRVVCLGGDHMIYEQLPQECSEIVLDFLNELD